MSFTTTGYGTWCNRVNPYSSSPDADVADYISGGDAGWRSLMDASGALKGMCDDYREAINAALPDGVCLAGDQFIGPHDVEDDAWTGYPVDENGMLDIKAICEGVDLEPIAARHDIITLEDIGRFQLKSQAKNPASVALKEMRRLGVKPLARCQIDGEGQAVSVYNFSEVERALAGRVGRGTRTDLKAQEETA